MAVAGVIGGVGQAVGGDSGSFWRQTGAGAPSALAGAAARSLVTGTSFGDNILAVLPDVIGTTVGRLAARAVAGSGRARGETSIAQPEAQGGIDNLGGITIDLDDPRFSLTGSADTAAASSPFDERGFNRDYLAAGRAQVFLHAASGDVARARDLLLLSFGPTSDAVAKPRASSVKVTAVGGEYDGVTGAFPVGDGSGYWNRSLTSFGTYVGAQGSSEIRWVEDTAVMTRARTELARFDSQVGSLFTFAATTAITAAFESVNMIYTGVQYGTGKITATEAAMGLVPRMRAIAGHGLRGVGSAAESAVPQVTANRLAGNAFRDEIAGLLKAEGRDVSTEVYKSTPFGKRFIDIEVSKDGQVLGSIETNLEGRNTRQRRGKRICGLKPMTATS